MKFWNVAKWILACLILGGVFYWFWSPLTTWIGQLDEIVKAALITVVGVAITALITVIVKGVENRHAVEAQFRKDRSELFIKFMEEFDSLMSQTRTGRRRRPNHLVRVLKDFQRKTTVWCSEDIMSKFQQLKTETSKFSDTSTVYQLGMALRAYGELILTMRKDLGLSNRGLDKASFGAKLILRDPDLLLEQMRTTPSMSTTDLREIEERGRR